MACCNIPPLTGPFECSPSFDACSTLEPMVQTLKALTIKQPFASLVVWGEKTLEIRTWKTNYRGRLLICAGKSPHVGKLFVPGTDVLIPDASVFFRKNKDVFPQGVAVGIVELVDCRPMTKEDELAARIPYIPGSFAWVFRNPIEVVPFDVKGKLGFFDIPVRGLIYKTVF